MSRTGKTVEAFADGKYGFFIGIAQLDAIDEKLKRGPYRVLMDLATHDYRSQDIRTILFEGLSGAGELKAGQALVMIERYVDTQPLEYYRPLALKILGDAVVVPPEVKKRKRAKKPAAPAEQGDGRLQFDQIYGNGAVMGMTPKQVGELSLYQYETAVEGYAKAHEAEPDAASANKPTLAELRAFMAQPVRGQHAH